MGQLALGWRSAPGVGGRLRLGRLTAHVIASCHWRVAAEPRGACTACALPQLAGIGRQKRACMCRGGVSCVAGQPPGRLRNSAIPEPAPSTAPRAAPGAPMDSPSRSSSSGSCAVSSCVAAKGEWSTGVPAEAGASRAMRPWRTLRERMKWATARCRSPGRRMFKSRSASRTAAGCQEHRLEVSLALSFRHSRKTRQATHCASRQTLHCLVPEASPRALRRSNPPSAWHGEGAKALPRSCQVSFGTAGGMTVEIQASTTSRHGSMLVKPISALTDPELAGTRSMATSRACMRHTTQPASHTRRLCPVITI